MRVKVKCQIVAVCVKEYIDARQNVAAACGLWLGAWGLGLFLFFIFFRISTCGYRPLDWLRSSHAGEFIQASPTIIFPYWSQILLSGVYAQSSTE